VDSAAPIELHTRPAIAEPTSAELSEAVRLTGARRRMRSEAIVFALVLAALVGCAIAPIWLVRFLPVLDEPNHLSAIFIWDALSDPASPLHAFYALHVAPVSYLLHYGLAFLFAKLVGVEVAHKLVLTLYVAAWPAAAYLWCRASGRSVWLSLWTLPLAFSTCWAHGYHPFNLGMAAFLFGVVAHDRLLARPSWQLWCGAALASLACYFGHPFPLALLALCAGLLWLCHGSRWRAALWSLSALLPSLAVLAWQARAAALVERRPARVFGKEFPILDPARWLARIRDFAEHAVNPYAGRDDSQLLLALLALAVLLFVVTLGLRLRERRADRGAGESSLWLELRALWLALALFVLYLIAPEHLNDPIYMWILRGRIAPAIAFFLLLSLPLSSSSRLRWVVVVAALVMALIPLEMSRRYREFDRVMAGLPAVMEACPREAEVLTVRLRDDFPGFDVPVFRELASWVQVVHGGGWNPSAFPRPIPFPFAWTRALPAPHWRRNDYFAPSLDPNIFGCVLLLGFERELPPQRWRLAREEGPWKLYLNARGVPQVR
jgi:hypothetical protein